jgi:uncharacterized membrane protein YgcG/tRNA A-37 threonylcarbamoyl transferase component Bud32
MADYTREMGFHTTGNLVWRFNVTSSLLGWQALLRNEVLFSGTDDPLLGGLGSTDLSDYITFPLARGAISINHNVPECPLSSQGPTMSVQDLIDIYNGRLLTWKEIYDKHPAENPCLANVTSRIIAFHRTEACGSNYIVQNTFHGYSPTQWPPPQLQWTNTTRINEGRINITRWENMQLLLHNTNYSLGYLPYATTVKEFLLRNVTIINPGNFSALPTAESIQNAAVFPDSHLNVTCRNCWAFLGSGYYVIPRHTIIPTQSVTNPLAMNSCINLKALTNFFTWGLKDDVSKRVGGAFSNISPEQKKIVLGKLSELTCNGKNVVSTDWDAHVKRANIALLVITSIVASASSFAGGMFLMKYRERQDVKRMEMLAKIGADEFGGFGLDSHLLEDFSPTEPLLDSPEGSPNSTSELRSKSGSPKLQKKSGGGASKGSGGSGGSNGSGGGGSKDGSKGSHASTPSTSSSADQSLVKVMIPAHELTIGSIVGSGSYGEVYRGIYKHKVVAIKRIASSQDSHMAQSFLQEVRAMVLLDHPNILRLLAIAVKSPYTYIVSEYCKFGSLEDYLKAQGSSISTADKLKFITDAARGMQYLHSKGVSHRDLKLNNLLVTENRAVKVGDLGTATTSVDLHRTRVGTLDYSAPEVLDGQPYTSSCDVYSFAICLWTLFSDQPLYPGWTMYDIIMKVVPGARPPIEAIRSPKMASLIEACWSGTPASRPSFDTIMRQLQEIDESDFLQT